MNPVFFQIYQLLIANGWVAGVSQHNIKIAANGMAIYIGDQDAGVAQTCHLTIIATGGLGGHWTINHVPYPRVQSATMLGFQNRLCAAVTAPMEEGELGSNVYTYNTDFQRALTALNHIYWLGKAAGTNL